MYTGLSFQTIVPDEDNSNFTGKGDAYDETVVSLDDIFVQFGAGIKTNRDSVVIGFTENELQEQVEAYDPKHTFDNPLIERIQYRPFDYRYIYYVQGLVKSRSFPTMKYMLTEENIGLIACSTWTTPDRFSVSVSRDMVEMKAGTHDRGTSFFPLLTSLNVLGKKSRPVVNLTDSFTKTWKQLTGDTFETEREGDNVQVVERFLSCVLGAS